MPAIGALLDVYSWVEAGNFKDLDHIKSKKNNNNNKLMSSQPQSVRPHPHLWLANAWLG